MRQILVPMALFVTACDTPPYPAYWPKSAIAPVIDSISPAAVDHLSTDQILTITGTDLESTQTVVIGDRNAVILSQTSTAVEVALPSRPGGDGSLDVSVITLQGFDRLRNGLTVSNRDWWSDEIASVAVISTECPIEAWASWEDSYYPVFWCGFEMGWASAEAYVGTYPQPGFAADLVGYTPYSMVPGPDAFTLWTEQDLPLPEIPTRYRTIDASTEIRIETPRDFTRDLNLIDAQLQRIADNYSWYDDVVAAYPIASFYDEQACYLGTSELESHTVDTVTPTDWIDGSSSMWLGVGVEEDYEGDMYYGEGYLSSASLSPEQPSWSGGHSGPTLTYNNYSGTFAGEGAAGWLGIADVPRGVPYEVSVRTDSTVTLGTVDGPAALNVIEPDILSGLSQIIQTDAFEITWSPLPDSDTPQKLIVELRVYDYETDTQNGSLELARLVTSANPTTGKLVIPAEQLQRLPSAPNTIDDDYNFLGAWGELNLILHQFRKVPYEDGELVIDFATVWSTPIDILPE